MKFVAERDPDAAMRKLLELANAMEADHAGRLPVGVLNTQFIESASVAEYGVAVKSAIDRGYLTMHPSGAYVMFTQIGAELFA